MSLASRLSVYLIADFGRRPAISVFSAVEAALAAGATAVQYRDKSAIPLAERRRRGEALRELTAHAGALYIVNDDVDLALEVDADGVHLGPEDTPPAAARARLGPHLTIGGSAGTVERARALSDVVDYLGVGAIYDARGTKDDASPPRGPSILCAVAEAVGLPIVAIGGVSAENAEACFRAGAAGVAVCRAVLDAPDPAAVVRRLLAAKACDPPR